MSRSVVISVISRLGDSVTTLPQRQDTMQLQAALAAARAQIDVLQGKQAIAEGASTDATLKRQNAADFEEAIAQVWGGF